MILVKRPVNTNSLNGQAVLTEVDYGTLVIPYIYMPFEAIKKEVRCHLKMGKESELSSSFKEELSKAKQ